MSKLSSVRRQIMEDSESSKSQPIVTVSEGSLRGAVQQLYDGSPYYSFKGIPYAQPPVGELRFKAPLPPKPWNNILDATKHGPICPQIELFHGEKTDENCLFLNVYTRSLQPSPKAAVMVFIHGGSFRTGSGNSEEYGPELLLQHNVVLVTLNYRLEVFGFLCLDLPEVPGNAGMKDQVAALRWVQKNIQQFGGDPENVTIFGESAGAASVTYHMLSPMSKGLFHKAIAQSGVCICDWAQGKHPVNRAFRVAKLFDKDINNTTELLEFFVKLPTEDFTKEITYKTLSNDEEHRGVPITFCPVVEKVFEGVESFLSEQPLDILLSGNINKVPLIVGYNSSEAIIFVSQQQKIVDFTNKHPGYSIPREIALEVSKEQLDSFGKRVRTFYVCDRDYSKDDVQVLCDKETDAQFLYNIHRFAHTYSKLYESVYMYRFGCDTELNFMKKKCMQPRIEGACHVDELYFMWSNDRVKNICEQQDDCKRITDEVTTLWTNFAKTGDPTPDDSFSVKWRPYTTAHKEYLDITCSMSVGKFADRERVEFWDSLYRVAGLPCINESSL